MCRTVAKLTVLSLVCTSAAPLSVSDITSWPTTMWGPTIVMVRVVCLSVCLSHTIHPKLSEIAVCLLGKKSRLHGEEFPIKFAIGSKVPPFWVFPDQYFASCDRHRELVNGSLGTVTGLCVIWLKCRMITHRKIPVAKHLTKLEEEFRRQERCFEFSFGGILHQRSRYLHQICCASRKWSLPTRGIVQYVFLKHPRWRTAAIFY